MPYKNPVKQKQAQHESYLRNKEKVRSDTKSSRLKRREIIRSLKDNPCVDCGNKYHYSAMQWDHRPGENKYRTISQMLTDNGLEKTIAEIEKCDLVCANCHAVRSWNRQMSK